MHQQFDLTDFIYTILDEPLCCAKSITIYTNTNEYFNIPQLQKHIGYNDV